MSLLVVRCPLKPSSGTLASSPSDWQDLACAERFEWCLIENEFVGVGVSAGSSDHEQTLTFQTGVGTTESMPYADQALVLIPTIDVRLIEAKVPLANAKKLQQILPNLVEEYLLSGAEAISVQALPPVPGKPAIQRTLALIDRAWFAWLGKQLEFLLCPRVRLIPDCLMLDFISPVEVTRTADSAIADVEVTRTADSAIADIATIPPHYQSAARRWQHHFNQTHW